MTAEILPAVSDKKHYPIAFNALPQIDVFQDNGYTAEEMKMINETKKIFSEPDLSVAATCVRLPVVTSHAESVYVEVDKAGVTVEDVWEVLRSEEHTSELQSRGHLVCRLLLEKKSEEQM